MELEDPGHRDLVRKPGVTDDVTLIIIFISKFFSIISRMDGILLAQ